MSAHDTISCTPCAACITTVFPMSANFRSSKIMNRCVSANARSCRAPSKLQSDTISACVFKQHISDPIDSASASNSFIVETSAATHKFDCFSTISCSKRRPTAFFTRLSARFSYDNAFCSTLSLPAVSGIATWFDCTNARTKSACSLEIRLEFDNISSICDIDSTECTWIPLFNKLLHAPCSRSSNTTTSDTVNPISRNGSTVSITLIPDVTKSSTTSTLCPALKSPSINFFVPYDFASFRRINIGIPESSDIAVANGNAVYGTPQSKSYLRWEDAVCNAVPTWRSSFG
mmetsp:Transcript_5687/g.10012  ORF Transcript_5687/g.10012 Transcript_5687/m.10012 type:complete len:289 (-) Transcript_5687:280-1146(-)